MKNLILVTLFLLSGLFLTSCSKIIETTIANNPQIIFEAIKKEPKKFFDTIQSVQIEMQKQAKRENEEKAGKAMDEEFKNPRNPIIESTRAIFGNKNAPITIVEYSDFQCPFCARVTGTMDQIFKAYGKKVRLVYKHLPFKSMAEPASRYYEAIAMQSAKKARKFHDKLYANQRKISSGEAFLKKMARAVGANMSQIRKDKDSNAVTRIIEADKAEAKKFGLTGTPGFIVNGVTVRGAYPFSHFKKIIDRHLKK